MAEDTGGTTSNLCEITPSDLAGTVGNLVNRIITLEQIIGQLLGVDVTADQLSDLSESLGWVTGITYLGCEGWTQTPAGTLIPPADCEGLSEILLGGNGGVTFYGSSGLANVKTCYGSYLSDIAAGTSHFLHPSSTGASYQINKGDTGLVTTAVGGSKNGWAISGNPTTDFIVAAWVDLIKGTAVPTSGWVTLGLYKTQVSASVDISYAFGSAPYPTGGTGGANGSPIAVTFGTVLNSSNPEGFTFKINNYTDGDIQINALNVVFAKV